MVLEPHTIGGRLLAKRVLSIKKLPASKHLGVRAGETIYRETYSSRLFNRKADVGHTLEKKIFFSAEKEDCRKFQACVLLHRSRGGENGGGSPRRHHENDHEDEGKKLPLNGKSHLAVRDRLGVCRQGIAGRLSGGKEKGGTPPWVDCGL